MSQLTKQDLKEIAAKRSKIENEMDEEIDSLLSTRFNARKSLNDDLEVVKPYGYGRRTIGTRATYRKNTVWSRPVKAKYGALD